MGGRIKKAAKDAGAWDMAIIVGGFAAVILGFANRVDSDEAVQIVIAGAFAFLLAIYRIRSKVKEQGDE